MSQITPPLSPRVQEYILCALLFGFDFPRQLLLSIRAIKIRIEAHNFRIEFGGNSVLAGIIEIEFVFPGCIHQVGHVIRLQAGQSHVAVDQNVLEKTRERRRFISSRLFMGKGQAC